MNKVFKTLIVEDEPPARKRLLKLLENFEDTFEVIGMAANGLIAKEKIENLKPDLIFLDIEMPELSAFEVLEKLTYSPLIIFCTAYDHYSLRAFETNSVDYLIKPVRLERLQQSVKKLKSMGDNLSNQNIMRLLQELSVERDKPKMTSITVNKGDKLIFIKLSAISYFKAEDRYVTVHSKDGKFLTDQPLKQLEQKLPKIFLRVHRGIIINKDYVHDVQKYFNSRYVITLEDRSRIISGRGYLSQIKDWLNG